MNTIRELLKYLILGGSLVLATYLYTQRNFVITTYTPTDSTTTSNAGGSFRQATQDVILFDVKTGKSWLLDRSLGTARWKDIDHLPPYLDGGEEKQWIPSRPAQ